MGGGGHHTKTTTVTNYENENIVNNHNNVKNLDNYYQEHNIETKIQNGDRVLGGSNLIKDDLNAGTAYYKLNLQNLDFFGDVSKELGEYSKAGHEVIGAYNTAKPTID